ncbi:L,D-transpeptidase family protein [Bdellovibrio sp. 22V]|uniref:L,D-transpeptidase family protein n=1 Tax=Bdellovibrio TaxID=958 RepID=UPI002542D528|nr:L,D-transpeptidase family protein [Bdellovibrio sp. 22V]WII71229.1 L,D-transpeptidase family protein [Bdellovibrio sp. 22V]
MRLFLTGCALYLISLPSWAGPAAMPSSQNETADSLPAPLLQISETDAFSRYVFLVDKEQRKLTVFERNGEKIKKVDEYPADIGKAGGNKTKRDDHKTPEGIYFLEQRLTQPKIPFSLYGALAFTTNYPNLFDQREKKTGSGIWLHAIPDTVPLTRGSRGCVVVRNEVIKKLDDYIKLRETPILIFDHVNYLSKDEHEKRRVSMNAFVESWRQAWEQQDIEKYMNFYDKDFKAPGFNFDSWKNHKSNLKSKYEYIKVHLSQPYIVQHNDQLLVKTLQRYESDKHVDYGVKTIYALKAGDSYKIIREEWTPFNQKEVAAAIARDNSMTAQANQSQQ